VAARVVARSVTRPVLALSESARKLGGRNFRMRVPVESEDEIGQLAESFNRMAGDLERTTVSREELLAKQKELEKLAGRLISAQEEERSRIARELHDDLTQRVAAVAIEAGKLEKAGGNPDRWRERLEAIKEQMARISGDIHNLSRRLHPSTLDDLGLVAAIESECRGFFERGGPPVEFRHEGSFDSIPAEARLVLYRIVQEALRNIQKHAGAEDVKVSLLRRASEVELEIRDNGRGFDRADAGFRAGLGLASMEERARLVGGEFRVDSAAGEGTRLAVRVPVERHA
jgi:signal transduction histidine kinase